MRLTIDNAVLAGGDNVVVPCAYKATHLLKTREEPRNTTLSAFLMFLYHRLEVARHTFLPAELVKFFQLFLSPFGSSSALCVVPARQLARLHSGFPPTSQDHLRSSSRKPLNTTLFSFMNFSWPSSMTPKAYDFSTVSLKKHIATTRNLLK